MQRVYAIIEKYVTFASEVTKQQTHSPCCTMLSYIIGNVQLKGF